MIGIYHERVCGISWNRCQVYFNCRGVKTVVCKDCEILHVDVRRKNEFILQDGAKTSTLISFVSFFNGKRFALAVIFGVQVPVSNANIIGCLERGGCLISNLAVNNGSCKAKRQQMAEAALMSDCVWSSFWIPFH